METQKLSFRNKISKTWQSSLAYFNKQSVLHRSFINSSTEIIRGISQYYIWGSKYSLLEGAFNAIKENTDNAYYPDDFFTPSNGWTRLTFEGIDISYLFIPTLIEFPYQSLKFKYGDRANAKIVSSSIGKIGVIESPEKYAAESGIFFKADELKAEELRTFLIDSFLKKLDTKCFSVIEKDNGNWGTTSFVVAETLSSISSKRATKYLDYVRNCLDKGIGRSFIFHGAPGTGKSTLASTLINELGFRTLKFRYTESYNFPLFKFLVRAFKVEAVLIDDFDTVKETKELLELLEFLKKETKLVIAIANTLGNFEPALLRPARIDEVIKIDTVEVETIKQIMGKLYKTYGEKVKSWPVAYINEFVLRDQIGVQKLPAVFKELDLRVSKQMTKLKKAK